MSLDLTHLIETAADEVVHASKAAAGSINELVHDWGHETRSFVADHSPSIPSLPGRRSRRSSVSMVRLLLPIAVLAVVALVIVRRRRPTMMPHLPSRHETPQDQVHESVVASAPGKGAAQGAAAS